MLKNKKIFDPSVKNKVGLLKIIRYRHSVEQYNLQDLDVSRVEDFSYLFCDPIQDGDDSIGYGFEKQNWNIEGWDFTGAKNTEHMFDLSAIDCDLKGCKGFFNSNPFKKIFLNSNFSEHHLPTKTDKELTGWNYLRDRYLTSK